MSRDRWHHRQNAVRSVPVFLVALGIVASLTLMFGRANAGAATGTSVGSASLSITSSSAGATEVTYSVTFVATHALTAGSSTVTLAAPAGTVFPSATGCNGPYVMAYLYYVPESPFPQSVANSCVTVSGAGANVVTLQLPGG